MCCVGQGSNYELPRGFCLSPVHSLLDGALLLLLLLLLLQVSDCEYLFMHPS
jgi:hypothetical protein